MYSFTSGDDGGTTGPGRTGFGERRLFIWLATYFGGAYGFEGGGTVFKITNTTLTTLHSFSGGADGGNPAAALVQGSNGYFYGTPPNKAALDGYRRNRVQDKLGRGADHAAFIHRLELDWGRTRKAAWSRSDGNFYGTTETDLVPAHDQRRTDDPIHVFRP